jgi:hypothetical protein
MIMINYTFKPCNLLLSIHQQKGFTHSLTIKEDLLLRLFLILEQELSKLLELVKENQEIHLDKFLKLL